MPEDTLRAAGLSRNKLASVRDLAARTLDGTVPSPAAARRMSDAELVARLTEVRGIGPWTVHMLLMFDLGRADVLPSGDYGVRMGFKKLYRKRAEPSPEHVERHAARWKPYRSVAAWYSGAFTRSSCRLDPEPRGVHARLAIRWSGRTIQSSFTGRLCRPSENGPAPPGDSLVRSDHSIGRLVAIVGTTLPFNDEYSHCVATSWGQGRWMPTGEE